jgi:hypothetical protein
MNQGLIVLASNACIAPWIGLFGTVVGMVYAFPGCSGQMSGCVTATTDGLARAIWPTALGLLIGLISLWFYTYLSGQLESIDREIANASLGLLNQLTRYRGHFQTSTIDRPIELPSFGVGPTAGSTGSQSWAGRLFEKYVADAGQDLRSWLRSIVLAFAALVLIWCARVAVYFFYESTPFHAAAKTANVDVLIAFGISCAYAVSYRRSAGALLLGSLLCLCLTLIELAFRMHLL